MLKYFKHSAGDLTKEMETKAEKGEEFELKHVFGKFCIDSLASSAFGVNAASFTNENSKFAKYAAEIFKNSKIQMAVKALQLIPGSSVSEMLSLLKWNTTKPRETKFFRDIILKTIRTRKETKEQKNDLVDLMLDCIIDDSPVDDDEEPTEKDMKLSHSKESKQNMDEQSIVATAIMLLAAGSNTTGMTLSFLAYEMSKNTDVQKKLQEEIDQAFEESGGEFPKYDVIQSLSYLDMVINETLRTHSPVGMNTRVATRKYYLPGTDIVIRANDMVSWNMWSLHFDPEHWSNPTEFYPEHFSTEAKANRNP